MDKSKSRAKEKTEKPTTAEARKPMVIRGRRKEVASKREETFGETSVGKSQDSSGWSSSVDMPSKIDYGKFGRDNAKIVKMIVRRMR